MSINSFRFCCVALVGLLCVVLSAGQLNAQNGDDDPVVVLQAVAESSSAANPEDEEPESAGTASPTPATLPASLTDNATATPTDANSGGVTDSAAEDANAGQGPPQLPVKVPTATTDKTTLKSAAPGGDEAADKSRFAHREPGDNRPALLPAENPVIVETASFKGMQPGKSTAKELSADWGAPLEIRKVNGRRVQTYRIDAFPKVTVSLDSGVVTSIVVNLEQPMGADDLATQLSLNDIASVQVSDDKGELLGEAFPERGVLFGYAHGAKTPQVSQVVLEPIDAAPFLLRAESHLHSHYACCLADANAALEIDPKSSQAHGLRARAYLLSGDLSEAMAAARAATELEPQEAEWKFLIAKISLENCDFLQAQDELQRLLDAKTTPPLAKAKAHVLLGDCLALAIAGDEQAVHHHMKAIKLAEPLVSSARATVRRGAKEVLLDAHLGMACDVGWGHWQQKTQAISKWVERAETLAHDLVEQEQADEDLLLRVDLAALSALAGLTAPSEPAKYVKDCLRRSGHLIEKSSDQARIAQLEWQLGLALSDAAAIEQARTHYNKCADYARQGLKHLEAGESAGRHVPSHDFILGRLHYRIGASAAIGEHDHTQALGSYERAVPLLETPVPQARLSDLGRHGETFVSMAVSYWEKGKREEAMRLTKQGVKLMQQAVEEGTLAKAALAVPYGNLASMHAELGDKQLAAEFAELAEKCERTKR